MDRSSLTSSTRISSVQCGVGVKVSLGDGEPPTGPVRRIVYWYGPLASPSTPSATPGRIAASTHVGSLQAIAAPLTAGQGRCSCQVATAERPAEVKRTGQVVWWHAPLKSAMSGQAGALSPGVARLAGASAVALGNGHGVSGGAVGTGGSEVLKIMQQMFADLGVASFTVQERVQARVALDEIVRAPDLLTAPDGLCLRSLEIAPLRRALRALLALQHAGELFDFMLAVALYKDNPLAGLAGIRDPFLLKGSLNLKESIRQGVFAAVETALRTDVYPVRLLDPVHEEVRALLVQSPAFATLIKGLRAACPA